MAMDDKQFEREKLRRDVQEALNSIDEAIAAEGTTEETEKDQLMCVKLLPFSFGIGQKLKLFMGVKDEEKES